MNDLVRICPLCGRHNPADETFCACGTLLADVDFTHPGSQQTSAVSAASEPPPPPDQAVVICPYADCAQPNAPGTQRCVYCNREIETARNDAAATQPSPLPAALRNRFHVLERLPTEGAQADLVVAETAQHEKRVIKLYRKEIRPDGEVLARLPAIADVHLIRLFEYGESEGVSFEVMEYCTDGSLRDLLDGTPQADTMLHRLIAQLSVTLTALHAQRILHRDLKPENILLRTREPLNIAVTDFGAATLKMATQYFTGGARTVHYAAPEVLTGVLDEKSDWWSFGMILLEAVTGRHPYAGLSEQVALHQLATESVDVKTVFDDTLRMLCRGLLLRNPKKRWGSDEVARWLAGDTSLAMPEDGNEGTAAKPYTLLQTQCLSRTDLALALARHWEEGKKDLLRGVVTNWVEHDLRDFNLARDIHDVLLRRDLTDDARLLRVIVGALPGIPPIWKGKIITRQSLVNGATRAINEDRDALEWLTSIYKEGVLDLFGECGNTDLTAISNAWRSSVAAYRVLWERAKVLEEAWRRHPRTSAAEVVDIDYLMYLAPIRMNVPTLNQILPDLVLALYLPAYSVSARNAVRNACAGMVESCSWYVGFVNETSDQSELFWSLSQRLLPFALEDAKKELGRQQQMVRNSDQDVMSVKLRIEHCCKRLLDFETIDDLEGWRLEQLLDDVSEWMALNTWLKGLDHDNATLRNMTEQLNPVTLRVMQLHGYLDGHQHLLDINAIWLKPSRVIFAVLLVSWTLAVSAWLAVPLLLTIGVGIYWRRNLAKASQARGLNYLHRMLESVRLFNDNYLRGAMAAGK